MAYTNQKLGQAFIAQKSESGHNAARSMRFEGQVLYSYNTAVAYYVPECRAVLISDERYSNTTSKQIGYVVRAAIQANVSIFRVPVPESGKQYNPLPIGADKFSSIMREWYKRLAIKRDLYHAAPANRPATLAKREREYTDVDNRLREFVDFFGLENQRMVVGA